MLRHRSAAVACLALWLVAGGPAALAAQSQPPPSTTGAGFVLGPPEATPLDGEELVVATEEVASLIRCPVCQGLSIADSPVDTAVAMKAEVREMLAEGYSGDQVFDYFEASYGEFIRLQPKAEGFNLLVWITPVLGLLLGLGIVGRRLARARTGSPTPAREETARDAPAEHDEDDEGDGNDGDDGDDEGDDLGKYLDQVRREVGS